MYKFGMERLRHRTAVTVVVPMLLIGGSIGILTGPASATTPVLQNGSFESGNYVDGGSGFDTLPAGSTDMTGWTVTAGSVDWIGTYWNAQDGSQSLDMNGTGPGSIAQTLSTVSGDSYFVQFELAGNPAGGPSVKTLDVSVGGLPTTYTFTNSSTTTLVSMGWIPEGYNFTATSSSTTLTFSGDSSNLTDFGPALDNVSVTQIVASGAQCKNGGWQIGTNPSTGLPYKNQGQCVSYFATSGATPIGS
jgi:choice-of-anchor C domain-containing protein